MPQDEDNSETTTKQEKGFGNYKPHPKQLEFFNDPRPRVLYAGGQPTRGHYSWVMKRFLETKQMMTGTVKNVLANKNFGFIRDSEGVEYFFHREEFNGHWDDLLDDMANGSRKIKVQFEPTSTPKGARATNVSRLDFPNQER